MPRKSKSSPENAAGETPSAVSKATAPKKKSRTPKPNKPAAAKKAPVNPPAAPAPQPAAEPTDDQIRLRAYFLAERRHRLSLPGDSNHDWIEARRQLIEEAERSGS